MNNENQQALLKSDQRLNFSAEHLFAKFINTRARIDLFNEQVKKKNDFEKERIINSCKQKMREIKVAILPDGIIKRRKVFAAWILLHRVDEELILLMDHKELAVTARKIINDIKNSSLAEQAKADWIVKIEGSLKNLKNLENKSPIAGTDYKLDALLLKTALNAINEHIDNLFWNIWTKKFIGLIYTIMLIAGIAYFLWEYSRPYGFSLCISHVMLLGAIGGLTSGIMSGEPEYLAKGHFWIPTLYYSLVRPTQGALAAVIMFWMIQSPYLIKIDPPLEEKSVAVSCMQNSRPEKNETQKTNQKKETETSQSNNKETLIVFRVSEGNQIYFYMLILFIAGFSGDKLLKVVSDRVSSRLFKEAEKTREAR